MPSFLPGASLHVISMDVYPAIHHSGTAAINVYVHSTEDRLPRFSGGDDGEAALGSPVAVGASADLLAGPEANLLDTSDADAAEADSTPTSTSQTAGGGLLDIDLAMAPTLAAPARSAPAVQPTLSLNPSAKLTPQVGRNFK